MKKDPLTFSVLERVLLGLAVALALVAFSAAGSILLDALLHT